MNPALLPSPSIAFGPDFLGRVGRLNGRLTSSINRREGRGRSSLFGVGEEFVGYRAYRTGEDLRLLDWNLMARLDQSFVRVTKREASEDWCLLLDTSASMGVGLPGKLQRAAEVAVALCALGLRMNARVTLWTSAAESRLSLRRASEIGDLMAWLEEQSAEGLRGVETLFPRVGASRFGRLFVLSDFFGLPLPEVAQLRRRGRELGFVRILAPEELVPELCEAVEWVDPESQATRRVRLDAATLAAYELELGRELELWREFAAKARMQHGCWSSSLAFESIVESLLLRT